MMLEPIEILVRLPLDDTLKVPHYPYVSNLVNPDLAERMEKMVSKMAQMLSKLAPPKCADKLKVALADNAGRKNQYSV
jgi:hypothetical protein